MILNCNICNGATIIAPSYLHTQIKKELISLDMCFNTRVLDFNSFFSLNVSKNKVLLSYHNFLLENKDSYPILSLNINSIDFIELLYSTIAKIKLFKLYDIPNNSDVTNELSQMISSLLSIKTNEDIIVDTLNNISISNIYVINDYYSSEDLYIYNSLISKGAIPIELNLSKPTTKLFYAKNKREEIESTLQYIINNNIDIENIHITLADTSYTHTFKQVASRYNLDINPNLNLANTLINKKFTLLLEYYLDNTKIYNLLDYNIFNIDNASALLEYLKLTNAKLDERFTHFHCLSNSSILNNYELNYLKDLETTSEQARINFVSKLAYYSSLNLIDYLQEVYELLTNNTLSDIDIAMMSSIKQLLNELKDNLSTKCLPFIISLINSLNCSIQDNSTISISNLLTHDYSKDYHFILGMDSKSFPSFTINKGIINEDYLMKLGYSSLDERFKTYNCFIDRHFSSSKYLICSYSQATYDGKQNEASLQFEKMIDNEHPLTLYKIASTYKAASNTSKIDDTLAKLLYRQNDILKASASSLEQYFRCPYAYFLKYGIRLNKRSELVISNNISGIIIHSIMDTLIKQRNTRYTEFKADEINILINNQLQDLKLAFNLDDSFIKLLKEYAHNIINENMLFFTSYNKEITPINILSEYKINKTINIEGQEVEIKGSVDRLDIYNTYFNIIDYKSSEHNLSMKDINESKKLQLPLYMMLLKSELNLKPLGMYYYNMFAKPIKCDVIIDKDTLVDHYHQSHKLKGLVLDDNLLMVDPSAKHINGMSLKDGEQKITKSNITNNEEVIAETINNVKSIVSNILDGKISRNLDECKFCDYKSICRNNELLYEEEGDNYE